MTEVGYLSERGEVRAVRDELVLLNSAIFNTTLLRGFFGEFPRR